MLSNEELDVMDKRVRAATPGPWVAVDRNKIIDAEPDEYIVLMSNDSSSVMLYKQDASFIAHARTDLPAALDEIRRLRKMVEAAREVWDSVPATRDEAHPSVMRHAKVMNDLRAALEEYDGK